MKRIGDVRKMPLVVPFRVLPLIGLVLCADYAAGQQLQVELDAQRVAIAADRQPMVVYRFGDVPAKPYVQELYTPAGVNVLRDAPHDHLHHHGLMFGVSVDGVSFWEEGTGAGRQQHVGFEAQRAESRNGRSRAILTESLRWLGPQGDEPMLSESRVIALDRADDLPATLLTWETRLTAPDDQKRVLGGAHYYGLGMRFVEAMDRVGQTFSATGEEGDVVRGTERLVGAKWVAYTAAVDGKPVTVALFDHPENPRHPARMFTMTAPFAYLSATMNLQNEPLTIEPGETLRLRYAAVAADGRPAADAVEQIYERWLQQDRSGDSTRPPGGH